MRKIKFSRKNQIFGATIIYNIIYIKVLAECVYVALGAYDVHGCDRGVRGFAYTCASIAENGDVHICIYLHHIFIYIYTYYRILIYKHILHISKMYHSLKIIKYLFKSTSHEYVKFGYIHANCQKSLSNQSTAFEI